MPFYYYFIPPNKFKIVGKRIINAAIKTAIIIKNLRFFFKNPGSSSAILVSCFTATAGSTETFSGTFCIAVLSGVSVAGAVGTTGVSTEATCGSTEATGVTGATGVTSLGVTS